MNIDWLSIDIQIRLIGVLALVFLVYAALLGNPEAEGLPHEHKKPVLALTLARSGAEIVQINKADGGKARSEINSQVKKDWGFIAVYLILFVWLSLLLVQLSGPTGKLLGWCAAATAVVAAISDLVENYGITKAIAHPIEPKDDSLANLIRCASQSKWAATYLFVLLVGLILISRFNWISVIGVLMLTAAAVGIRGIIGNALNPNFHQTFPLSLKILGGAALLIAIPFTLFPGWVFRLLSSS